MTKQKIIQKLQNKIAQYKKSMKLYSEMHKKYIIYDTRIKAILPIIEQLKKLPNKPKTVSNNENEKIFCYRCHGWDIKKLKNYYLCKDCNMKWSK